ncbi:MAG: outer membrane lipoprotein carrier protein LolA [Pseudomonadota bacterium]
MTKSHFTRRTALTAMAAAPMLAAPNLARADLRPEEISRYFNDLRTGKAEFTQLNSDGSRSQGIFYINRPGRMRFEYTSPTNSVVVAGNTRLAIFEDGPDDRPKIYPLNQTPLWLLLKRNVDLTSNRYALGYKTTSNATILTVQDPDKPQYGQMQLVFTENPTTLRQWVVTTPTGERTTVILGDIDTDVRLSRDLFDVLGLTETERD